jgi:hypothetical protein
MMADKRRDNFQRPKNKKRKGNAVTFSQLTLHKLGWLEWVAIVIGIWFFVFPRPYILLFSVLLALPIIGLILNGLYKPSIISLVEITKDKDGDNKYDVADFIDIPAWVMLIRVLLDFEFESFYSLIIPGAISFAGVLILLFFTHKRIGNTSRSKTWIYLSLISNICLYSYAGTYGANCVYDNSTPKVYETTVLDKHTYRSSKGGTRYYLTVAPWGHHYDKEDIKVSSDQYRETDIDETVKIDYKEGLFGIPWYYVKKK